MFEKIIERIKNFTGQIARILPDIWILGVIIGALMFGFYKFLPAPLQVLLSKVLLVSTGFLHAHITRKIAFPKVDWDDPTDNIMKKLLVIALYVIFIYAYAQGG